MPRRTKRVQEEESTRRRGCKKEQSCSHSEQRNPPPTMPSSLNSQMASAIENYDQSDDESNSELIIEGSLTPTSNDQEKASPQRQLTMGPNQDQHADYQHADYQSDDESNSELIIEGSLTPTSNDQEKASPQRQLTMGPNQDQHADYITVKRKQFKNVPKGQPTRHSENWQENHDDASPKRQPTMEQSQATNRKRKAEESQAQSNKRLNITNIIYISFAKDKIPSRMTFTKSIRNLTKVQYSGQTRDLKTGLGYSIKPESPQIAQIITQANLEVLFPDTEAKIGGRQHKTINPRRNKLPALLSQESVNNSAKVTSNLNLRRSTTSR